MGARKIAGGYCGNNFGSIIPGQRPVNARQTSNHKIYVGLKESHLNYLTDGNQLEFSVRVQTGDYNHLHLGIPRGVSLKTSNFYSEGNFEARSFPKGSDVRGASSFSMRISPSLVGKLRSSGKLCKKFRDCKIEFFVESE